MLKKVLLAFLAISVVLVGLGVAGFRVERAGSGWPRFIARSNDDVLEADRARQKSTAAPTFAPASQGAPADKPNASTFAPTSQTATVDKPIVSSPSWSAFRGPNRDGRYTASAIRTPQQRHRVRHQPRYPTG